MKPPQLELLRNADVYAPEPLGRRDLLIAGGRIVWMGERALRLPADLEVVEHDLDGKRLCPGFVDGHVHITGGGGEAGPASRVPPLALSRFTAAGTTTVVGLLGTDDNTRSTASLIAAARALTAEGLSAYCYTGGYHLPPTTLTGSVRDDITFIDCVIGVGEVAISDHRSSQPTLAELERIAADAYVAGLLSGKAGVLQLHLGDGARGLELVRQALDASELPPRVFVPTHVNRRRELFDEALELAGRGVTVDVTAFPSDHDERVPVAEAVEIYFASGLPATRLTASTDAGGSIPRFDADHRLVEMGVGAPGALAGLLGDLLRRGHALENVLPLVTSNVASALRLANKGVIRTGADADLVALDADHLVTDVMARGAWHVVNGEARIRGRFEIS